MTDPRSGAFLRFVVRKSACMLGGQRDGELFRARFQIIQIDPALDIGIALEKLQLFQLLGIDAQPFHVDRGAAGDDSAAALFEVNRINFLHRLALALSERLEQNIDGRLLVRRIIKPNDGSLDRTEIASDCVAVAGRPGFIDPDQVVRRVRSLILTFTPQLGEALKDSLARISECTGCEAVIFCSLC